MTAVSPAKQTDFLVKLAAVRDSVNQIKIENDGNPKIPKMIEIVAAAGPGKKTMIVCKYGIDQVINALNEAEIEYADLTQHLNAVEIDTTLEEFRASAIKNVVVLNPKFYGRGLDIQCVDNLIVMHSIGRSVATQWLGRAMRQNRACDLKVWFIITDCEPGMDNEDE
jgi:superfamily II DNA/RNA helicase